MECLSLQWCVLTMGFLGYTPPKLKKSQIHLLLYTAAIKGSSCQKKLRIVLGIHNVYITEGVFYSSWRKAKGDRP